MSMKPTLVQDMKRIMLKWAADGQSRWLSTPFFKKSSGLPPALNAREAEIITPSALTHARAERLMIASTVVHHSNRDSNISNSSLHCGLNMEVSLTLGWILSRAITPELTEYLANGSRWRVSNLDSASNMSRGTVGSTTGNEGDHFDLKAWGRNVHSQTKPRARRMLKLWTI